MNWCANVPKISRIHAVKANRNNSHERIFSLPWRSGALIKCVVLLLVKASKEDVINLFSVNRISGEVLPLLSDGDLKELGVAALGDRKLLLKHFKTADQLAENARGMVKIVLLVG